MFQVLTDVEIGCKLTTFLKLVKFNRQLICAISINGLKMSKLTFARRSISLEVKKNNQYHSISDKINLAKFVLDR
jgi:hypothetical protein